MNIAHIKWFLDLIARHESQVQVRQWYDARNKLRILGTNLEKAERCKHGEHGIAACVEDRLWGGLWPQARLQCHRHNTWARARWQHCIYLTQGKMATLYLHDEGQDGNTVFTWWRARWQHWISGEILERSYLMGNLSVDWQGGITSTETYTNW